MTPDLSILCVTRGEPRMLPFLREQAVLAGQLGTQYVLAVDIRHDPWIGRALKQWSASGGAPQVHVVRSAGYLESVLDEAIALTSGRYVLRLDDDETASPALAQWLLDRRYLDEDHWCFPRAWLIERDRQLIGARFWPDLQTRLSIRAKAGGRHQVHCGSPFGAGTCAPYPIVHHALLVKSQAEREALVAHYEALAPGSGAPCHDLYVPEAQRQETVAWP